MAPQNNLERQAARKLAEAQGIKYTEALRRLRASRIQPSEALAALQADFTAWPSSPAAPSASLPVGATATLADLNSPAGSLDPAAHLTGHGRMAAVEDLLTLVLDTQGQPALGLFGPIAMGKTALLRALRHAAALVPDVRVFMASSLGMSDLRGLPEFLRETESAACTALVLLDDATGFMGHRDNWPDNEPGRAVAERLILRGHPAAAVVAASHLPLPTWPEDSGRVIMGWQKVRQPDWSQMGLPTALDPGITALREEVAARYSPLYVPVRGEARLLGDLPAVAAHVALPGKPVNPLAKEECPGDFSWSAFGADYPDTQCDGGRLVDMDSLTISEIPCPFDNPEAFTEYQFGDPTFPECSRCSRILPVGTEIHYHEGDNGSLWWSAACPDCGLQRVNMVDHGDDADIDALCEAREQEARAGHALARAAGIDYAEALHRMRITKAKPADLLEAEAGTSRSTLAQTLMAGGIPEKFPFDPSFPTMDAMRFLDPPGKTLQTLVGPNLSNLSVVAVPNLPTESLAKESCPGTLLWSAFDSGSQDTACRDGRLVDIDSQQDSGVPCPYCEPAAFTRHRFGEERPRPMCGGCGKRLASSTEIHYHEDASEPGVLWWSAECPDCGLAVVLLDAAEEAAQPSEPPQITWWPKAAAPAAQTHRPAAPSFTLGHNLPGGVPLRAVLAAQAWAHTAVVGQRAATAAELVRIAAELAGQGVAVTVFSGSPEQSWPEGVRVIPTGPGRWAAARAAAEQMEAERLAVLDRPLTERIQAPEPLVILVDAASMDAMSALERGEGSEDLLQLSWLCFQWLRKGRITDWTMVQAMDPDAQRGLKDMAWVLVPDAAQVSWSGWPQEGRALRNRHGMIHSVHP